MNRTNSVSVIFVAIIAALLMFVPAILLTNPVNAQGDEQAQPISVTPEDEQQSGVTGDYVFVAQPGDSYSKIARKAVQIYGIESKTALSQEQIIFAETNLTIEAGSPVLTVGQTVTISKSDVANWASKAIKLSTEQQAAWAPYAASANFDTNNVGE